MATFIGVIKKDGGIRTVEYLEDGSIDVLGITLCEYYQTSSEVRPLVKTTIFMVDEDEVRYEYDERDSFETYDDEDDFIETVDLDNDLYYLYNGSWKVIGNNNEELRDLETVIEEGEY